MKKKIIVLGIIFSFILNHNVSAFSTKADSAFLIDYNSGEVIYEKNADKLMPPSSMLKLMTLYMLFDEINKGNIKLNDEMNVSKNADYHDNKFYTASKICLEKGQKLKVIDAILGIIVMSGGDASIVVAEHISGSEEKFAKDMEKKAREIGLTTSTFGNSTGLPNENNLMTTRELALLSKTIIEKFPDLYTLFKTKSFEYEHYKNDWCKKWGENHTSNYNKLLFISPSADGLKTGHTDLGGYGVATSALRKNRRLIGIINGLKANDHSALAREAKNLLDYGYTETENKTYFSPNETLLKIKTWYASKDYVEATIEKPITITKKIGTNPNIRIYARYPDYIKAPIQKGQQLGTIYVEKNNEIIKTVPLIAKDKVRGLWFIGRIFRNINIFFTGGHNG